MNNYYSFIPSADISVPTCVPNTGSGNRGKRCCGPVFYPFPDNGRKQICEGRAVAGGHDINL